MESIMKNKLTQWLNQYWYREKKPSWWLQPLAFCYRVAQRWDKHRQSRSPSHLPVIVVGNLTVGGTGKTPVVIAICHYLRQQGIRVGVVTRGYQNQLTHFPYLVKAEDDASLIGDEAALIAQKTQVPVVIAPKRNQAIEYLHQHQLCDWVISDDGLQHYAMARHLEIIVIDGARGFGNGALLPIGPLRESLERLAAVDFILVNGPPSPDLKLNLLDYANKTYLMQLQPEAIVPQDLPQTNIAAFAGIGHPERFFKTLRDLNIQHQAYSFPDHHQFVKKDFDIPESCIIMTEKDAIKCRQFKDKPIYTLPVSAKIPSDFWEKILNSMSSNICVPK